MAVSTTQWKLGRGSGEGEGGGRGDGGTFSSTRISSSTSSNKKSPSMDSSSNAGRKCDDMYCTVRVSLELPKHLQHGAQRWAFLPWVYWDIPMETSQADTSATSQAKTGAAEALSRIGSADAAIITGTGALTRCSVVPVGWQAAYLTLPLLFPAPNLTEAHACLGRCSFESVSWQTCVDCDQLDCCERLL